MLQHLAYLLRYTLKIPQFPLIQIIATTNEIVIAFMVAILLLSDFSERDIIGLLALMMIASGAFLSIARNFYNQHRVGVVRSMLLLAAFGMTFFSFSNDNVGSLLFVLAASSIICCRDIMAAQLHGSIREQSERHGTDTAQIFAFVIGFGILFSAFTLYVVGLIADQNFNHALSGLALCLVFVAILLSKNSPNKKVDPGVDSDFGSKINIPYSVYAQCCLSFCYNGVSYFGRRLAIPLLVIEAGDRFGFSDSVFSVLGLTVGLLALLGLVSQRVKGRGTMDPRLLMFLNYFFGLAAWLSIGLGLYAVEHFSDHTLTITLIGLIVIMLAAEVSSKLWSVGFMESIKLEAIRYGDGCQYRTTELQHAFLGVFLWMKNLGAGAGFILAYAMYDLGTVGAMVAVAIVAAIYGVIAYNILTKRLWNPLPEGA